MNSFDTILFDLDGTLTDSAPGIIECFRFTLAHMEFPEPDNIMQILGPPLQNSFSELCGMDSAQTDEAVKFFRRHYSEKYLFVNSVYEGVPQMLEELKSHGIKLLVATCKAESYALRILEKFGLSPYFDFAGGADINGSRSTKSQVIEYVLENARVSGNSRILMVGDRMHDIEGAHSCGIPCMAVAWGYGNKTEFTEYNADFIAENPKDLLNLIIA
ncbi:MAG: HAD family hydrolase [Ruminococcus sp.]|nr:HAD family hydrolase [Ruminococcus sp.]